MSKISKANKGKHQPAVYGTSHLRKAIKSSSHESFLTTWGPVALLALSAIIVFQSRIQLLAIPLERDEAGFAYIGHWLLKGKTLYVDMVDNKLPGLYMLYALFTSIFGYDATGVHIGLLLANIASGICFYFLLREVYNRFVAAMGTAFFFILVTGPNMVGFAAHATQLLLPFVLGGWLLFWKGIKSGKRNLFFLAGLLLGLAFIIKQQSIVFGVLAAGLWWPIRWQRNEFKKLPFAEWILLGVGGLLPAAITVGYFFLTGHLEELFFWTYAQPVGMAATFDVTRSELFVKIIPHIIKDYYALWAVAAIGMVTIWISGLQKNTILFGLLFAILGLGSVVIGAAFYNHYFILAVPGVALLAALALYRLSLWKGALGELLAFGIAMVLFFWPVVALKEYFFKPDYAVIHQKAYNQNMFPEIERIGKELANRVKEGDKIGVLGSEPGILMAAGREGCSKHLFMYPLLSDPITSPALQEEFIKEIETCKPEYIVWNTASGSWSAGYQELKMFKQILQWTKQNYTTSGIAEFRPNAPGVMIWDMSVSGYKSQSQHKVYVFKRMTDKQ